MFKIQSGMTDNVFTNMPSKSLDRQKWNDRENGNLPGYTGKQNIIVLIPYCRSDDGPENILDRERIVGTYISSAREYENVDIKLQRQAI